jgi:hypothetical protein
MTDNSDLAEAKLVDFGLSKMIGPNETSTDPFGTLVILHIYLYSYSHMLHLKSLCKDPMERMSISGPLELSSMFC